MEDSKNRNLVEKKLKEAMRKDRARIQIGEISNFGLLELSRQRLRPSVIENSSELCPQCGGSGRIQSIEVSAIQILRSIEEEGNSNDNIGIKISAHSDIILHILYFVLSLSSPILYPVFLSDTAWPVKINHLHVSGHKAQADFLSSWDRSGVVPHMLHTCTPQWAGSVP